jgi:hypothetical protein
MGAMSRRGTVLDPPTAVPSISSSPPATRSRTARWRDPRLVVGLVIIAVSALLGARLLGADDGTVPVWATVRAMQSGEPLTAADLERREVRFAAQGDADRYVSAEHAAPDGVTLDREVGAGELLPRAAVGAAGSQHVTEVPFAVDSQVVPGTVRVGSVVDVWVTPDPASTDRAGGPAGSNVARSVLVLDDVPVVSAPTTTTALGPSVTRQITVGVGSDQEPRLPAALAALAEGSATVTVRR